VRTADLHAWYPLQSEDTGADDFSGNDHQLLKTGTPTTDVEGPPLDTGYTIAQNTTLSGILRAVDPDGNPLTFALASQAGHGTVVVNANGTFSYVPAAGFIGADAFTFTVSDGFVSVTGRIDITVTR
jgi:hypothetical protein